ncbi:hypothetical protein [Ammoniphilus sp. 3BR4]|uniref:hypothetical protein n=1 Tax=Ammoniphilus sp. 3BR4 TaxID=3158265 RepID=UPI003467CF98
MTNNGKSYSQMRHDYIKDWPNAQPFVVEKEYNTKIANFKEQGKELFLPHPISHSSDTYHNIAVSFLIDALDVMPLHPNFAFDFIFRAFDNYSGNLFSVSTLKDKLERSIDTWERIIENNEQVKSLFNKLLEHIPQITCQYLYSRIFKNFDGTKPAEEQSQGELGLLLFRLLRIEKLNRNNFIIHDTKMKEIIELAFIKFGFNEQNYSDTIRKGSRFFYRYFNKDLVKLPSGENGNEKDFTIETRDKLHLLVNGILFTMRNDRAHGASSSSFKSSKASLRTYAHNHFCFMTIYFLLHLLMIDQRSSEIGVLTNVMNRNVDGYLEFYNGILEI